MKPDELHAAIPRNLAGAAAVRNAAAAQPVIIIIIFLSKNQVRNANFTT
jgi:hypothetical protein